MTNNSLLLIDPNFKTAESINCHLLLKITNDSFSYAVVNKERGQVNVIFDKQHSGDIEQDLKVAFETDAHLTQKYGAIKAAVYTSNFIFIPHEWFDADNQSVYSKFLGSEGKFYTQHHTELGFNTLFSISEKVEDKLPKDTRFYPQSSPLFALFGNLSEDALLIDFTASTFNVLFVKDKKVIFQNHYSAETAEEFNYFLLLIIEQLGLNESVSVYLQGIINEDDDYYNTLLKYFNNLYFFLPAGKQSSDLLADMPKHYFSGLLALDLCE
ncbi:DUF3822 family protein [Pedobacter sp. Leaf194]|uniref:DUF3822 family protein n=1 Tax=Pedobacter sp. Leaf194 TaxID=1736297 RepID=UPI000702EB5B|nr:DUF3822 family protein [Pedobacter sp. Leaf194]KQS37045.1 hypothetical protein ASG14_08450 [Pedobacter sp. Leaf194]